ncbi:MAG: hypothetical protein PVH68_01655 [Armatimonadota bacterium]
MRSAKKKLVRMRKKKKVKKQPTSRSRGGTSLAVIARLLLWLVLVLVIFAGGLYGLFAWDSARRSESPSAGDRSRPRP